MKLYKKVYIKSAEDLPKKRSLYFVGVKRDNLEDVYEWFDYRNPIMADNQAKYWINTFDWYLQPIEEISDEEIEKEFPTKSQTITLSLAYIDMNKNRIFGAKWYRNKMKGE